ncbi:MAG: hypothetical protein ISR77_34450 [Pirellulaceae bacterium]|nr:hypothetical protein [Pirellulaceae bacterium]
MTPRPKWRRQQHLRWLRAAPLLLVLAGCGVKGIDSTYGKRRGTVGGPSVNGTGVLAEMFEEAGHKVTTKRFLSPRIDDHNIIVWAPDDFEPPTKEQQEFLEDWLDQGDERTLVYIARDYDAAIAYWEKVRPSAPPEQAVEVARRLARAKADYNHQRTAIKKDEGCRWFDARRDGARTQIGRKQPLPARLNGTWSRDGMIDHSGVEIEVQGRLDAPADPPMDERGRPFRSEVLLKAGKDVLVRRITCRDWYEGQIIVVTNGSFLLNLPLVEKENRKLAGKLIAECGTPGKVVFLESGPGGPLVLEQEPGENYPTGMEAFTVWPIGAILLHFLVAGILYIFARAAIFGRPHELPPEAVSDFGKHIHALGELLARTQDHRYARERLAYYHEKVKRGSGTVSQEASEKDRAEEPMTYDAPSS